MHYAVCSMQTSKIMGSWKESSNRILTPLPSPHILLPLLQYNNINHTRRVITTKVLREAIPKTNLLIFELCLKGVGGLVDPNPNTFSSQFSSLKQVCVQENKGRQDKDQQPQHTP